MSNRKTGQYIPCIICGKLVYRQASHIKRGVNKTCGASACKSKAMSGANNPFWGKNHDQETIDRIQSSKKARPGPRKKTGPPKGYNHTPEARAKITAALRERWRVNRDKMLSQFQKEPKPREQQRYRFCFTPWQRETWTESKCLWCDSTEDLVLDHIVPVMCGGLNEKRNSQTLCQPCNMWKMRYIDRPMFLAGLGSQGGQDLTQNTIGTSDYQRN